MATSSKTTQAIGVEAAALEGPALVALRLGTSQASALAGGGGALLLTLSAEDPGASLTLRAAASFADAESARRAATACEAIAREAVLRGSPQQTPAPAEFGAGDGAGLIALPLVARGRACGALIVSVTAAPSAEHREALEALAWSMATSLDHRALERDYEAQKSGWTEGSGPVDEDKSDELLKLSEELFAQDLELLRQNEKLGKIEKLKNDFIEKMSRELRTPLNSIIEATITVLAGENENLSEHSQATLRAALDEGTAFQRTLQNILDLWRIKQDELPIENQELSFAELIDETIFSVQDTLRDKPVEIVKEIPEPLPKLRGDLAKINQILFLLLDNAAKFTPSGSIKIGARMNGNRLHCSIEDTGIGICADDQQYIWNEFYQVDDRNSAKYRGAGLGLTLVQDLLTMLEGDSMLESEPGRGTKVEFSIPVSVVV